MALDIRTLMVIALLTSGVSVFSMFLLYLGHRHETALRHGVIGLGLQCAGLFLLSLRSLIPDTFSIVVANTMLITSNDSDGEDYASLYREADRRLYAAKEAGRNRVVGRGAEPCQAEALTGS